MWKRLAGRGPIMATAPLANCSDAAFRRMVAKYSPQRSVIWNEFVNTTAMLHEKGWQAAAPDLEFSEAERPIVAQIFGSDPAEFELCAQKLAGLGYDGIDINMVAENQQAGAGLIKDWQRASAIVDAAVRGAGGVPVSVKTRTGFSDVAVPEWLLRIAEAGPAAITLHARTRDDMSAVPARWDVVRDCASALRDAYPDIVFLGNGDVRSVAEARRRCSETGVHGVMVGRALFGRPWLFGDVPAVNEDWLRDPGAASPLALGRGAAADLEPPGRALTVRSPHAVHLALMVEHALLFEALLLTERKSFAWMTKFFKAYCSGFQGSKPLRAGLMPLRSAGEVVRAARTALSDSGRDDVWRLVRGVGEETLRALRREMRGRAEALERGDARNTHPALDPRARMAAADRLLASLTG